VCGSPEEWYRSSSISSRPLGAGVEFKCTRSALSRRVFGTRNVCDVGDTDLREEKWWVARGSNSPTAAIVVQGSSEGGAHEPLADGGETPRPQGASNPGPPD